MQVLNFYMDDSGSRRPNRASITVDPKHPDYFALGGVLIKEEDEAVARAAYASLCEAWSITYPLHSADIRHASKDFSWLRRNSLEYVPFMRDLTRMLTTIPVLGIACVIDRPGYEARYRRMYGRNQWNLCQTAFCIAVERAAKYAHSIGHTLRVLPECSSRVEDQRLVRYFNDMRAKGLPFDSGRSGQYAPLSNDQCGKTLIELRFKRKQSPLVQIADLYLWPIANERYCPGGRPYAAFHNAGRLIENVLSDEEIDALGTKHFCFELIDRELSCAV